MTYRPPSKMKALDAQIENQYSLDKMLSFRDTWKTKPLDNFSFDAIMAAADAPAPPPAEIVPLEHDEANGFHVIDKTKLSKEEALVREAQRSLNQLAEENFEAVVPPLLQPALFQSAVATQVVERIFEKCIDEPKFAPLYARMCLRFCTFEHEFLEKGSSFRRCLVSRVQKVFHEEPIPLEKKYSEEDMTLARKRKMANTQLVSRLMLCGVLANKLFRIILEEIFMKQQFIPELMIEIGCELIEIVCCATPAEIAQASGNAEGPNQFVRDKILPSIIQKLRDLLTGEESKKRLCMRVQFRMMEILDMSERNWHHRPGTLPKARSHAPAPNADGQVCTPTDLPSPASGVTAGTPLFPKDPSGRTSNIPSRLPKLGSARSKFVQALKTSLPGDTASFQQTVTQLSVLLTSHTVPINRMACISAFIDNVARSHDAAFHEDALAIIAHPVFDAGEVVTGFLWTVIEGTLESIREDCPKYFDRLGMLFAKGVLLKRAQCVPFISLIRDVFVPATDRIAETIKKDKGEEFDEEMCAEELVHAWESFLKKCTSIVKEAAASGEEVTVELPKFSECATEWSKAPWTGALEEIALPDVLGAFLSSDFVTDEAMRQWVDTFTKKPPKAMAVIVNAVQLLC